ncbi:hypothetical protein NA56DRAFT_752440 [Hyaloscypha hepaticicola]|uniref:Uncharacterized protein n=1 Tax=Hyaloscypha hepaticicola TaxID=2082293 RepID=A0A2J6PTQ3_9HELO|nr:hypothetical protein NA56DRAFT_752440 [Hyaloscypha hepaticicola]
MTIASGVWKSLGVPGSASWVGRTKCPARAASMNASSCQPPPRVPAKTSYALPSISTNSSLRSSSSVYYSAGSQPLPSSTTSATSTPNNKINFDLPFYPSSKPLPRFAIELETIKDATRHTRHFFHRYVTGLQGSWHEKQIFPEESFAEVPWQRVEERWRKGQGYMEKKGGEGLAARGGRIPEWVKRDDVGERGRQRIGWMCKVHGWGYWVREIRWEDDGEDEDGGEREEENERFQDSEE